MSAPEPVRHRPRRAAYALAAVLPILLVLLLAAPAAVALWLRAHDANQPSYGDPAVNGQPGVGDPYFPDYGSSGYDALAYDIDLTLDPQRQRLDGLTVMTARATQRLNSFSVDLALPVTRVVVDSAPARSVKTGFSDLQITPVRPIEAGAEFTVLVDYGGSPGRVRRDDTSPFYATGSEWMVSGEPESSAWWFPANDHPSDPATMDISLRVPAGFEAISTGRLESRDTGTEADFDTWHWICDQPQATYLTFVTVGQYQLATGTEDDRPYVYAVSEQLPAAQRSAAMTALRTSGAVVRELESAFGPYPFTELGGIVPAHKLWFDGLETQTRPIYAAGSITDSRFSGELLAHELSHMWFGDQVRLREWNDIFINEAYASYGAWLYSARHGGLEPNARLDRALGRTKDRADFWRVRMSDPGPDNLFSTVYGRGPMTLVALRNVMGAAAFDTFTRAWVAEPATRSLEDWMAAAQAATPTNLTPFFDVWIRGTTAPARTAANGFR